MTNPNDPIGKLVWSENTGRPGQNLGLTKREYFAAIAMQGVEAANNPIDNSDILNPTDVAKRAVRIADALIEALNKEGK